MIIIWRLLVGSTDRSSASLPSGAIRKILWLNNYIKTLNIKRKIDKKPAFLKF